MAVMNVRPIIAFLMGLVLQLSQVQSCRAIETAKPCATQAHRMSCCEGLAACPCAKKNDSDQKPAPVAPATVDLKLLVSKAAEPSRIEPWSHPPTSAVILTAPRTDSESGYAGVPLSVAFCCFVI